MRKTLLFVFCTLIAAHSFGQFNLGLVGGINVSSLSTDLSDYEQDMKFGYKAGAFARLGTKLHLQPEIYFSSKKSGISYSSVDATGTTHLSQVVTFNSIDVPLLVGYKIFDPPLLNIRLNAGPVATIATNKKFETTLNSVKVETDETFEDSFQAINWGLQFGAGLDFSFLTFDIRYELGMNNIYNKPNSATDDDISEMMQNVFFVCVGFKFF
jgi:hypothetical protein